MSRNLPLIIFLALLWTFSIKALDMSNLVRDGGFEDYHLMVTEGNQTCAYLPSNYTCWYNQIGGPYEIKLRINPPPMTTTFCQLAHDIPYTVCQNITLEPTIQYQLNYTVFNSETTTFSTIITYINNNFMFNHTTLNELNISNATYRFVANQSINKLCFDSRFSLDNVRYPGRAPGLDNISVVRLSPLEKSYDIYCTTQIDYTNEEIILSCLLTDPQILYYLSMLQSYIDVYINEQKQGYEIMEVNITFISFKVIPQTSLSLQNILIVISDQIDVHVPVPDIRFFIDGVSVTIMKSKEFQKKVVKAMYLVSEAIMGNMERAYFVLKSCVASYFLMNIINFWNLTLMYNVLNISTIPAFCKNFLQRLTLLFFNLNSLTQWAQKNIPFMKNGLNFDWLNGRENIEKYKNNFSWFGSFGVSSNFISNNFETFFMIFFLITKILILLLIRKIPFLPKKVKKKIPSMGKFLKCFLLEFIGFETFMIMSAAASMSNLNCTSIIQKLNNGLQVTNFFVCLMAMAFYFIVSIKVKSKKKKKQAKQLEKQKNNPLNSKPNKISIFQLQPPNKEAERRINNLVTEANNIFEFVNILIIPSFILLNHPPTFLIITSLILLFRIYWFCKNARRFTDELKQKVFNAFNILFLTLLQCSYVALWILEKIVASNPSLGQDALDKIYYGIKIIGFIIVFTIVVGGAFEILNCVLDILKDIIGLLRKMIKKLRKALVKQGKITSVSAPKLQQPKFEKNRKVVRVEVIKGGVLYEKPEKGLDSKNKKNPLKTKENNKQNLERNRIKVTILNSRPRRKQNKKS